MKKVIFVFILLLMTVGQAALAQEILIQGGGGISKQDSTVSGNYGFAQARLMFGNGLRIGPYVGLIKYGATELFKNPNSALNGTEWLYGLALDFYGPLAYSYSTYAWITGGLKNATDRYDDGTYRSTQKTNGIFISGGIFITDEWQGWFGNNRLMFDYYHPTKASVTATYRGDDVIGAKPYNKEALRFVLETGIKRFGSSDGVQVEPLIHLGYGSDFGRFKNYYEIGGGLDLGLMKVWYRDIMKLKIFWRQDINSNKVSALNNARGGTICGEITFDLSSFVKAVRKN